MSSSEELKPLLVPIKEARRTLGGISHNRMWRLIAEGHFEVVGHKAKRYITTKSLEAYVASMPRVTYPRPADSDAQAMPPVRQADAPARQVRRRVSEPHTPTRAAE